MRRTILNYFLLDVVSYHILLFRFVRIHHEDEYRLMPWLTQCNTVLDSLPSECARQNILHATSEHPSVEIFFYSQYVQLVSKCGLRLYTHALGNLQVWFAMSIAVVYCPQQGIVQKNELCIRDYLAIMCIPAKHLICYQYKACSSNVLHWQRNVLVIHDPPICKSPYKLPKHSLLT